VFQSRFAILQGDRIFAVPPVEQLLAPNYGRSNQRSSCGKVLPYLMSLSLTFNNQKELEVSFFVVLVFEHCLQDAFNVNF